jgi:apolipoprotein N-acyltransferase
VAILMGQSVASEARPVQAAAASAEASPSDTHSPVAADGALSNTTLTAPPRPWHSARALPAFVCGALAFGAGALLACSFAPLSWWPLAILSPAVLIWLWQGTKPREAAWLGFWFNAGTFAAGTYWLYISIHVFGQAPIWLAVVLMTALVAIMGVYHAALGYSVARWLPASGAVRWMIAIPAAWLLIEWLRGWFLSGFAWLSLGYTQTDTWLAWFAPVTGVYGISLILLVSAGALVTLVCSDRVRTRLIAGAVMIVPWLAGAALSTVEWTHPSGAPVSVAVVQGAIPQDQKWQDDNHDATLDLYQSLTEKALGAKVIVWPEAAIPDIAEDVIPYITNLYREARTRGSSLVIGVLHEDEKEHYYNAVLGLDDQVSWYFKVHLVPFAEFFPVPHFVRSWLRLHSLPYSDFTHGGDNQGPLPAGGLNIAGTVCWDDAYGSSLLQPLRRADALVNVTNDAWFGHSTARYQHFQIARMRAIETGRYLVRAANDGLSGVIGPRGEIVARAPEFKPHVLVSAVTPRTGLPPYAYVGNWLVVLLACAALAYGLWVRNDRR